MIAKDLASSIGNTPLIKLRAASEATGCSILGKAEFVNPGQSVKDRAALYIIRDAEEKVFFVQEAQSLRERLEIQALVSLSLGLLWVINLLL